MNVYREQFKWRNILVLLLALCLLLCPIQPEAFATGAEDGEQEDHSTAEGNTQEIEEGLEYGTDTLHLSDSGAGDTSTQFGTIPEGAVTLTYNPGLNFGGTLISYFTPGTAVQVRTWELVGNATNTDVYASQNGLEFVGWYSEPGGQGTKYEVGSYIAPYSDTVLYGHFTPRESSWVVTYETNVDGQLLVLNTEYVPKGNATTTIPHPEDLGHTRDGYTFLGWSNYQTRPEDNEPLMYQPGETASIGRDIRLWAQYAPTVSTGPVLTYTQSVEQYTAWGLSRDLLNGYGKLDGNGTPYETDEIHTLLDFTDLEVTPPTGMEFSHYTRYGHNGYLYPGDTVLLTEQVEVFEIWFKSPDSAPYTVTYYDNGADSGTVPVDATFYAEDATVTVLDNTGGLVKAGHDFVGWSILGDPTIYKPGETFTITQNTDLYAVWEERFTVTYDVNTPDTVTGSVPVDDTQYPDGVEVQVQFSDLDRSEHRFLGWSEDATATEPQYTKGTAETFTIHYSVTLYAVWGEKASSTPPTVDLIVEDDTEITGTGVAGAEIHVTWPDGTTATGQVGTDGKWSVGVTATLTAGDICTVTQTEPGKLESTKVEATVRGQGTVRTLIYDANTDDAYTGTLPEQRRYDDGATVQIDEVELSRAGYTFLGWSEEKTATSAQYLHNDTFTIVQNVTLYAVWQVSNTNGGNNGGGNGGTSTYTLTYRSEGQTLKTETHTEGTTVTVWSEVPVKDDAEFTGWVTSHNTGLVYQPGDTFVISRNMTLIAQWSGEGASGEPVLIVEGRLTESDMLVYRARIFVERGQRLTIEAPVLDRYSLSSDATQTVTIEDDETLVTFYYTGETVDLNFDMDEHVPYLFGYPDNSVRPDAEMTRAEIVTIFYRLLQASNGDLSGFTSSFTDVESGAWYYDAVACLEHYGYVNGYADGTFRPDEQLTRAEFSAIISRFNYLNLTEELPFDDLDPDHWAAPYLISAYSHGWLRGYEDNTIRPEQNISRAEVVTMVNRMLNRTLTAEQVPSALSSSFTDLSPSHWAYGDIIEASHAHEYEVDENGVEHWTSWELVGDE